MLGRHGNQKNRLPSVPGKYNYHIPRLTVEITEKQQADLNRVFAHGMRREVFGRIIDDLISAFDEHGHLIFVALMDGKIKIEDVSPCFKVGDFKDGKKV